MIGLASIFWWEAWDQSIFIAIASFTVSSVRCAADFFNMGQSSYVGLNAHKFLQPLCDYHASQVTAGKFKTHLIWTDPFLSIHQYVDPLSDYCCISCILLVLTIMQMWHA